MPKLTTLSLCGFIHSEVETKQILVTGRGFRPEAEALLRAKTDNKTIRLVASYAAALALETCKVGDEVTVTGDMSPDAFIVSSIQLGAPQAETKKEPWTQKRAYEANKLASVCVVCGKPLRLHPSVSVKYCKCIESLS